LNCQICGKLVSDKRIYKLTKKKGVVKLGHKKCIMTWAGIEKVPDYKKWEMYDMPINFKDEVWKEWVRSSDCC